MMSYKELYEQYVTCIETQNKIIAKCRQDYVNAIKSGNRATAERLSKILKIYYDERNDLVTGANEMKKYIEDDIDMVS